MAGHELDGNRTLIGTLIIGCLVALYFVQRENYLLFHGLTEVFSIAIAWGIFIVAWNGRRYLENSYLILLGIAYLFVGFLDLLHTLGYKGMGVFSDYDFYANQLWVAARYLESISLFVATFLLGGGSIRRPVGVFTLYAGITGAFVYSIFFSDIFPPGFVEGVGQTSFKIVSEYIINAILLATLVLTLRKREAFARGVFGMIVASIALTIVSELAFTFYISNYGLSNMIGHYAKIASFYLLYRAVIKKSIADPYASIFETLSTRTEQLHQLNEVNQDIFAIISHDLRTPFATMSSFTNLMREGWKSFSEEEIEEILANLSASVDRTYALTENLLCWARAERHGVPQRAEVVSLAGICESAADPLLPHARDKQVSVDTDCDHGLFAMVDRKGIEIAVRNLLSNALKYSNRGGSVRVRARGDGAAVELRVEDDGVGMDLSKVESLSRLLCKFFQTGTRPSNLIAR